MDTDINAKRMFSLTEYDEAVVMKQLREGALEVGIEIGREKGRESVRKMVALLLDVLDEETIVEKTGLTIGR